MGTIVSILLIPTGAILVGYGFGEFVMPLFTDDIHEQNSRGILSGYVAFVIFIGVGIKIKNWKKSNDWIMGTANRIRFQSPLGQSFLVMQLGLLLARTIFCWYVYDHSHPTKASTLDGNFDGNYLDVLRMFSIIQLLID